MTNPMKCDQEVFDKGISLGLFDMSRAEAEAYVKKLTDETGNKHDWHFAAGRVHIKYLPAKPKGQSVQVHKVTLYVIDFDHLGAAEVSRTLEQTRYTNRCIEPAVLEVETKDIGEWSDSHPLNYKATNRQELARLFDQPRSQNG